MTGERRKCADKVDKVIAEGLPHVEDQFFVCDMAEGMCASMLKIGDRERCKNCWISCRDPNMTFPYP